MPRDAHLRAALRHAPDADVQPPAHVSAQILAAAHRAAASPPARARPAGRRWFWQGSSPGVQGAYLGTFASVLLAGVLGLLWRGGAPGPAVDQAPAAASAPPAPARAAATPEAAPAHPPAQSLAHPPSTPPAIAPEIPPEIPPADAMPDLRSKALPTPVPRSAPLKATPPAELLAQAPSPPSDMDQLARPAVAVAPAATAMAAATLPVPSPAPPPAPLPAQLPAPSPAPSSAEASAERMRRAAPALSAAAPSLALGLTAAPTPPALRWRVDAEDRGLASAAWLRSVRHLDQQRGQPSGLQALSDATRVDLLRADGGVDASAWITSDSLLWCRPAAGCRSTALTPDESAPLLQALKARR